MNSSDRSDRTSESRHARSVGILAYGSLRNDPGPEIAPLIRDRLPGVMTPFAVEFARSSCTRDGGPTVIPVESGGTSVPATILILDQVVSVERAEDLLWRRETRNEASDRHYLRAARPGPNDTLVERLLDFHEIGCVLYTRIGRNIEDLSPAGLADLAIISAQRLAGKNGRDGISYLIDVKNNGVCTQLSAAYEQAILDKTDTPNLHEALLKCRQESLT